MTVQHTMEEIQRKKRLKLVQHVHFTSENRDNIHDSVIQWSTMCSASNECACRSRF